MNTTITLQIEGSAAREKKRGWMARSSPNRQNFLRDWQRACSRGRKNGVYATTIKSAAVMVGLVSSTVKRLRC